MTNLYRAVTKIKPTLNHTKSLDICSNVSDTFKRNDKGKLADEISVVVFDNAVPMILFSFRFADANERCILKRCHKISRFFV